MNFNNRLTSFKERLKGIDKELQASAIKLEGFKVSNNFRPQNTRSVNTANSFQQVKSSQKKFRNPSPLNYSGDIPQVLDSDQSHVLSNICLEIDRSIGTEKACQMQEIDLAFRQKEEMIKSKLFSEEMSHKQNLEAIEKDFQSKKEEFKRQYKFFVSDLEAKKKEALEQETNRVIFI